MPFKCEIFTFETHLFYVREFTTQIVATNPIEDLNSLSCFALSTETPISMSTD